MAYADALKWPVTNRRNTPIRYNGAVRIQLAFDDRTEKRQAQPGQQQSTFLCLGQVSQGCRLSEAKVG